jgi:hypothetical protein
MNFFDRLKIGNQVLPDNKKTMSERYPSASPALIEYLEFKEGKISLEKLSDKTLILVYKEKVKFYNFEVGKRNLARNPNRFTKSPNPQTIEKQDETTARVRQELNVVLAEVRKRKLPEDQPELRQDGIL